MNGDEVRRKHIERLGEQLGPVYHALWSESNWMHLVWAEYRELFATSEERVGIIKDSAPLFFHLVQRSFEDQVLLYLTRLTDPAKTFGKNANLIICALPELCDTNIRAEVQQSVDDALVATKFARDIRNRRISHGDLELALGTSFKPLAKATRDQIDEAMKAIHAAINLISLRLMSMESGSEVIYGPNGSLSLLHIIRRGLKAENQWRQRMQNAAYTVEDLERNDPL